MKKTEEPTLQKRSEVADTGNRAKERVRKVLQELAAAHWEKNPLIQKEGDREG